MTSPTAAITLDLNERANRAALRTMLDVLDEFESRSQLGSVDPSPASGSPAGEAPASPASSSADASGSRGLRTGRLRKHPSAGQVGSGASFDEDDEESVAAYPSQVKATDDEADPPSAAAGESPATIPSERDATVSLLGPSSGRKDEAAARAGTSPEASDGGPVDNAAAGGSPAPFRPWTDADKRWAWALATEYGMSPTEIGDRLGRPGAQVKVFLWNVRDGRMLVPTDGEPQVDWKGLVARVRAGEGIKDVARSAGVNGNDLQKRLRIKRPSRANLADDADWPALVERVLAGERCKDVAREAGVKGVRLNAYVGAAKARARREAAAAVVEEPEPAPKAIPVTVRPSEADPASRLAQALRAKALLEEDRWNAQRDLALAEAIMCGSGGVDRAAAKLRLPRNVVLKRWNELLPVRGLSEQSELLKHLRERAESVTA